MTDINHKFELLKHIISPTTDNSIARPMTTTEYSINPLDKNIDLDADRVYGSVDDLLTKLKETAQ